MRVRGGNNGYISSRYNLRLGGVYTTFSRSVKQVLYRKRPRFPQGNGAAPMTDRGGGRWKDYQSRAQPALPCGVGPPTAVPRHEPPSMMTVEGTSDLVLTVFT